MRSSDSDRMESREQRETLRHARQYGILPKAVQEGDVFSQKGGRLWLT
jgi:hypothetical protein